MNSDSSIAMVPRPPAPPESFDDFANLRLALMRQLLASLCASHRSLLTMDLAGIELGTREQLDLSWRLAEHLRRSAEFASTAVPERALNVAPDSNREHLSRQLREVEGGVFQALRLHSALLVRARRKLRILTNMLADPGLSYGSLLERTGVVGCALDSQQRREI